MQVIDSGHFVIEYSEPPTTERKWAINKNLDVLALTVEDAIAMLREYAPLAVVHVVRRVGTRTPLLVDENLLTRLEAARG